MHRKRLRHCGDRKLGSSMTMSFPIEKRAYDAKVLSYPRLLLGIYLINDRRDLST